MIGFSLLLWLSSAMLLCSRGEFYFTSNFGMVVFLSAGVACLLPPPPGATKPNQHTMAGKIIIWIGLVAGLAHVTVMLLFPAWSAWLLELYSHMGFRGAFVPGQ